MPSVSFHVLEKLQGGLGDTQKNGMEEGRTYEIATFFKLSPN